MELEMEYLLIGWSYLWKAAVALLAFALVKFLYKGVTVRLKYRRLVAQGIVRVSPKQDRLACGSYISGVW